MSCFLIGTRASAFLLAFLFPYLAVQAAYITHDGSVSGDTGTGIGNTLTTLILQSNGSESGSILWNGTNDVDTGDTSPSSQTRTSGELIAEGIDASNTSVIFNINQTGANPTLNLNDFVVRFFNADATMSFDAVFDDPTSLVFGASVDNLSVAGQGTGTSGYVFRVHFDGNEPFDFFGSNDNRVGMLVAPGEAISGTNDGPENFFFLAHVPEPNSLTLLLLGSVPLFARKRR